MTTTVGCPHHITSHKKSNTKHTAGLLANYPYAAALHMQMQAYGMDRIVDPDRQRQAHGVGWGKANRLRDLAVCERGLPHSASSAFSVHITLLHSIKFLSIPLPLLPNKNISFVYSLSAQWTDIFGFSPQLSSRSSRDNESFGYSKES